ncbi:endonuclease V-like isoform X2 [Patiria miniata]|uniref:Endonuclease V n=1 Tax=Patiria miniata TaxID=46514 RepID=A0A914ALQ2_PATMI|nr:endonuclease V-like isoform X2 [Patiria miniata]
MSNLSRQTDKVFEEFHQKWEREQQELKKKLVLEDTESWRQDFGSLRYIGGVDVSFVKTSTTLACASLVVCDYPDLKVVYSDCELVHLDMPYIPGFLAFREVGFFLNLLDKLKDTNHGLTPQVILVDGNGILHPRGFGIASHLGVLSGIPCVGVAKTLMQVDGIAKDEKFAAKAMRGCDKSSNPIFVSVGHRVSLQTATELARRCCKYRVTEPVRQADIRSREFLRDMFPETAPSRKQQPKAKKTKAHEDMSRPSHANEVKVGGAKSTTCFLDEEHSGQSDEEEESSFDCLFGPT